MHKQICATLEPLILEITFTIFLHSSLRFYTCFHVIFSSFEILLLVGIKNETKVGSEVQFWVYNLYEIPKECNNMHFHIVFRYYNERLVVEDTILFLNPIPFSPFFANCSLFLEQIGGMYFHFLNWNLQFAKEAGYFWHQQYFILF